MTAVLAEPPLSRDVTQSATGSPLTRFIGRDAEVATLLATIPGTRLLSLVGPGGSGKTRLARAVLGGMSEADSQRTWWVPLAQLDRPALIVAAVADAVGVTEVPGRCLRAAVIAYLSEHDGLLVLDNCEDRKSVV